MRKFGLTLLTAVLSGTLAFGASNKNSDDVAKAITNLVDGKLIITGYYPDGTKFNNVFEQQAYQ